MSRLCLGMRSGLTLLPHIKLRRKNSLMQFTPQARNGDLPRMSLKQKKVHTAENPLVHT